MKTYTYESPLGTLDLYLTDNDVLARLDFHDSKADELPDGHKLRRCLDEYFLEGANLDSIEVELHLTSFQQAVLNVTRTIPRGEVRSYKWIAAKLGKPRASRAVGNALGANPIPIVIPCHRVVASNGLGGYTGGLEKKTQLLDIEGFQRNLSSRAASASSRRPTGVVTGAA